MNRFPSKNYFTLPNEIFSLGLSAGEIAVYAYLRCLENPSTYQCWPSYTTIGKAIGRTKNTVMQYAMRSRRKDSSPQSQPVSWQNPGSKRTAICAIPSGRSMRPLKFFTRVNCLRLNEQQSGGKFIASCPR